MDTGIENAGAVGGQDAGFSSAGVGNGEIATLNIQDVVVFAVNAVGKLMTGQVNGDSACGDVDGSLQLHIS